MAVKKRSKDGRLWWIRTTNEFDKAAIFDLRLTHIEVAHGNTHLRTPKMGGGEAERYTRNLCKTINDRAIELYREFQKSRPRKC